MMLQFAEEVVATIDMPGTDLQPGFAELVIDENHIRRMVLNHQYADFLFHHERLSLREQVSERGGAQ
jgi:hypothetical protein